MCSVKRAEDGDGVDIQTSLTFESAGRKKTSEKS